MIFALLSLLTVTAAIRVTSPSSSTVWASGTSAQTITWEAVSSDPNNFVIQLVNQAGYLSNSPITIKDSQSSSSGNSQSTTVTYPGGTWPVGVAFQINLVTSTQNNQAILAQSSQFNISNSGTAQAASSGNAPSTLSGAASTASLNTIAAPTSSSFSASGTSGDASGGIPNAAASSRSAGEKPSPSAFVSLLLAGAAALGLLA